MLAFLISLVARGYCASQQARPVRRQRILVLDSVDVSCSLAEEQGKTATAVGHAAASRMALQLHGGGNS